MSDQMWFDQTASSSISWSAFHGLRPDTFFQTHTCTKGHIGAGTHACSHNLLWIRGHPYKRTHTHAHSQRLSAGCNEMSNQLCQIACLPEGEERGGVCAKIEHLLRLLFLFFFLVLLPLLQYLSLRKRGEWNIVSPEGDRAEASFCQDITPPLHSCLLSSLSHLKERSIWLIASSSGSRRDRWGERDEAGQCAFDGRRRTSGGRVHTLLS